MTPAAFLDVAAAAIACEVDPMRKPLSFALALVFVVACKAEPPASSSSGSSNEAAPTGHARSAKIDVKPILPGQPAPAPADGSDDREAWRKRRQERMDTNGDGVVSDEERAAAMKQRMQRLHDRLDTDGDGKLTPAELAAAPGRMHFDNPEALDTNHDGNIDADELAAGMKARREAFRAARQAQQADGEPASAGSAAAPNPLQ